MLSVILTTVRPQLAMPVVENLLADGAEDLVVVADWPERNLPTGVRWLVRERRGVVDAVNLAMNRVAGDTVFVTNDESRVEIGTLAALEAAVQADQSCLYGPRHVPAYPFFYYGKPFLAFPCAHRSLIQALGGLFDPRYRSFYADPDLSMRAHEAGVPVVEVDGAVLHHGNDTTRPDHMESVAAYLEQDRAAFRARWDHLGAFCDP